MVVQDEEQLSIALSVAISTSSDAIEEECGSEDSVEAATGIVAESVLKEINESIKDVEPEAQDIFQVGTVVAGCLAAGR